MRPCFVLLVSWVMAFAEAADIEIFTNKSSDVVMLTDYGYVYPPGGVNWFTFQVKICSRGDVCLYNNESARDSWDYRITIGGWNNTKSFIRSNGRTNTVSYNETSLLSCDEYRSFWIAWCDGDIFVGRGLVPHQDVLMALIKPTESPVNFRYVGLRSPVTVGHWKVPPLGMDIHTEPEQTIMLTDYGYVYEPGGVNWFTFHVKVCLDAFVHLYNDESGGWKYEVLIGGWRNTESRMISRGWAAKVYHHEDSLVSCDEYRRFWISWHDGDIFAGRGSVLHQDVLMSLIKPTESPVAFRYVGLYSKHQQGYWKIPRSVTAAQTTSTISSSTETSTTPTTWKTTSTEPEDNTATSTTSRSTASESGQTTNPTTGTSTAWQTTQPTTETSTAWQTTQPTTETSTAWQTTQPTTETTTTSTIYITTSAELDYSTTSPNAEVSNTTTGCKENATWNDASSSTVTQEKFQKLKQELAQELLVNKSSLSSARRRKISAPDSRASSAGMGFVAGIILGVVPVLVVMADMPRFIKFVKTMKAAAGR